MSQTAAPPLALERISKSYGPQRVLAAIDLSLRKGEIFGLIGLNGVGKTTLIKIILDLTPADSGSARIFGEPSTQPSARRALSYLPEKFQPSGQLTGREYLSLTHSYYRQSLHLARARQMAVALDLDAAALDKPVRGYSKGMGQKLGLLGAFLIDQPFLVLDEPMSGLDPRARIRLKQQLLVMREAGKTIFFSSHILSDIDEICDRIGILHDGALAFVGTPAEFKSGWRGVSLEQAFLQAIS